MKKQLFYYVKQNLLLGAWHGDAKIQTAESKFMSGARIRINNIRERLVEISQRL